MSLTVGSGMLTAKRKRKRDDDGSCRRQPGPICGVASGEWPLRKPLAQRTDVTESVGED